MTLKVFLARGGVLEVGNLVEGGAAAAAGRSAGGLRSARGCRGRLSAAPTSHQHATRPVVARQAPAAKPPRQEACNACNTAARNAANGSDRGACHTANGNSGAAPGGDGS